MKKTALWCAVAAALGPQVPAWAQGGATLEEITVTATRRAQDLQDVPVSIVAVTGENLEMRGLQNLENLNGTIPNLSVMGSTGGGGTTATSFTVRGIPNVGVYIDGIWQVNTSGLLTQEFVDIERIEVLRGPQGTLYGRDSVGGAIRIVTERPGDEFAANVKATVGTYDRQDVSASVDVPLADNVLTKFTFGSLYRDGYLQNRFVNQKNGGIDQQTVRGDLVWMPSDSVDFRFKYNQSESSFLEPRVQDAIFLDAIVFPTNIIQIYTAAGAPITNETQTSGYPGGDVGLWETNSSVTNPNRVETEQMSMEANWDVTDNVNLQFLTGVIDQNITNFVDFENTQYALVEDLNVTGLDLFSQEIQLSGGSDRFQWVGGLFYWDQKTLTRSSRWSAEEFLTGELSLQDALNSAYCQQFTVDGPGPSDTCQEAYNFYVNFAADALTQDEQDGWAIFGEGTYSLTDALALTVGLRYHDQSNAQQPLTLIPGVSAAKPQFANTDFSGGDPLAGSPTGQVTPAEFDKTTGRLSLQYDFSDAVMGYVSYSQGFNSGGVDVSNVAGGLQLVLPYEPETVDNYEVGVRSDLLNGRIRLNATLFMTEWDNIQASGVVRDPTTGNDLPGLVTTNVGTAEAQGLEVELTYLPTDNLTLNFNLGLLDTAYTDIKVGTEGLVPNSTEFSQAPDETYNLGLQHNASLNNGGTFISRLDYTYTSEYRRSPNPTLRADFYPGVPEGFDVTGDFGMVNARFTYQPAAADWEMSVFGTNLSDEYILNSGFFHGIWGIDFATVARPREAGVSFRFSFN